MGSPELDQKLYEKVEGRIKSSFNDAIRMSKMKFGEKGYKNWHNYVEKPVARKSNLFVPVTHNTVQQSVALHMQALWNQDGFGRFAPREEGDVDSGAGMTAFFNYSVRNEIVKSYQKFYKFFQHRGIYGIGIFRDFWRFDYRLMNGRLKITHNHYDLEIVLPRNFYIDPLATSLHDAKWCAIRSWITVNDFKAMVKMKEISKQISTEDLLNLEESRSVPKELDGLTNFAMDYADSLVHDKESKWIEIVEYFSAPDDEYIVTARNGQKIIRNEQLPWEHKQYPVAACQDIPDPETFWGKGTTELLVYQQAELNAVRNNRMDRLNFLTNPVFKVKRGIMQEKKDLVSYPGKKYEVEDKDDITRLDFGSTNAQEDIQNEQTIKTDMQVASGISDYTLGNQFASTATGTSLMDSQTKARIMSSISYFDDSCLKDIAYHWQCLNKQFYSTPKKIYADGQSYQVRLTDFAKEYDFYGVSEQGTWNRQARQNALAQFGQYALRLPGINQVELAKEYAKAFGISGNIFNPAPPMMVPGIGGQPGDQAMMGANPNAGLMAQPDAGAMGGQGRNFVTGAAT